MNPLDIIAKYYPVGSEAYRILVIHSRSVADKALAIARMHPGYSQSFICHTSTMNNQNPVRLRTYRIIFGNNI